MAISVFGEFDSINYSIASVTEQNNNYPASEVTDIEKQFSVWRTTTTSQNTIILDLGQARALNGLGIINTNYTNIVIIGSANSNLSSPSYSESAALKLDLITRRYRLFVDPQSYGAGSFNARYLGIQINSQTPVDNAAYFFTGGIVVTESKEELLTNVRTGFSVDSSKAANFQDKLNGGFESIARGDLMFSINFSIQLLREQTELSQFSGKFLRASNNNYIAFKLDNTVIQDSSLEQYFYIAKTKDASGFSVSQRFYDTNQVNYQEMG